MQEGGCDGCDVRVGVGELVILYNSDMGHTHF